jgi:hypothetical protein
VEGVWTFGAGAEGVEGVEGVDLVDGVGGVDTRLRVSFETSDFALSFETPGGYVGQARRLCLAGRFAGRQLCNHAATERLRGRQGAAFQNGRWTWHARAPY